MPLDEGETITTIMKLPENEEECKDLSIMFATSQGNVRRNSLMDFVNVQSNGKIAMKLDEGDKLINVRICTEENDIMLAADATSEQRDEYARISSAAKRIQAERGGDCEVSVEETGFELSVLTPELYREMKEKEQFILSVTSTGYGKRTSSYEYRTTGRGGQGIANMEMSARNKEIVSSFPIEDDNQIMMVTDGGKLIRMPVKDIRIAGRKTQGVILFRTADDERVVSVTWLDADAGDDEELEEETGSEVLGESVSELDEALSDAVSEPDAAEDVE